MAVKRSFSSAIVYSRKLPKGKVDLMVLFMMDNHRDLFKVSVADLSLCERVVRLPRRDMTFSMSAAGELSHWFDEVLFTQADVTDLFLLYFPPDSRLIAQDG